MLKTASLAFRPAHRFAVWLGLSLFSLTSTLLPAADTTNARPLYVYNFGGLEKLSAEQQVAVATEAGFAGLVLDVNNPEGMANLPRHLAYCKPPNTAKIVGIFTRLDFVNPAADTARYQEVVRQIVGRDIPLWIILGNKKPGLTKPEVETALATAVDFAGKHGVRSALYPHSSCFVNSAEEALPYVTKINRPDFTLLLNLCHEMRAGNGGRLAEVVKACAPHVSAVVVSGADAKVDTTTPRTRDSSTIQPLDRGAFDWFSLVRLADEAGIRAPVAFINFNINKNFGQDYRNYLPRSMDAWRKATAAPAPPKKQGP